MQFTTNIYSNLYINEIFFGINAVFTSVSSASNSRQSSLIGYANYSRILHPVYF